MDRRTLLNTFLGLLMAISILGSMPMAGGQTGISTDHHNAVAQEDGQDSSAPFGQWTSVLETTSWYLHRDEAFALASTPAGTSDLDENYYLDLEKPQATINFVGIPDPGQDVGDTVVDYDFNDPNDKKVRIDDNPVDGVASAYFTLPMDFMQTEDVRVYGLEASVFVTCNVVGAGLADASDIPSISASLNILDFINGVWTPRTDSDGFRTHVAEVDLAGDPVTSGDVNSLLVYGLSGKIEFGNPDLVNGPQLNAPVLGIPQHRLQIGFHENQLSPDCYLHFDSANFPSVARITADSARLNAWIENVKGDFARGLSAPSRSTSENRKFLTQIAQVSAWPHLNGYFNPRNETSSPCGDQCVPGAPFLDDNTAVDYMDDFWDLADDLNPSTPALPGPGGVIQASDLTIRVRDLQTFAFVQGPGASQVQQESRTVANLGDSVNRVQYTFGFPETLPEHPYRAEIVSSAHGVAATQSIQFGIKGFAVDLLDGSLHAVNPNEATEFRLKVRNTGSEDDTITVVASPPGDSWAAEVVGASTHLLRANGGEAEVVLRVTPSSTALAGASKAVTVTASSANFPGEVLPITRVLTVNVVAAVARGVDVTSNQQSIVLQPGTDTSLAGIRVKNTGTAADSFVLQPSIPAGVTGWTVQATPLSRQISANSSADFSVRIRAPVDAQPGQTFTLGLVASRLGDLSTTDRADLTVIVQVVYGVVVNALENPIDLRNRETCPSAPTIAGQTPPNAPAFNQCVTSQGGAIPVRDNDFDRSAIFRVTLTNPAGVEDTYRLIGAWKTSGTVAGVGITQGTNSPSCDGLGRPAWWRYEFGNASAVTNAPDNIPGFTQFITVGPKQTQTYFLELGYLHQTCGTPAPQASSASQAGAMTLTFRSGKDPSKEQAITFGAYRTATGAFEGTNDYAGAARFVSIEADASDADAAAKVLPGVQAEHLVRIVNRANERDNLLVTAPASNDGWTRQLQFVSSVPSGPAGTVCTATNTGRTRWVCPNMGANDEALFKLNVTPVVGKPLGQNDRATVRVSSGDDGTKTDELEFVTTTVGTFNFDAQALSITQTAEKGKTALLPFVLHNLGSSADRLNLSLVTGDPTWTPRLGLPQSNFVPAGKDLNGFLSITVPASATTNKQFVIQVTSQGNGAIDTMAFTVEPITAGLLRLRGDPSNITTLPQTGVPQYVNVSVNEPAGTGSRTVNVAMVPGSLPAGWTITPNSGSVNVAIAGSVPAIASFQVTAPAGALGNSRVPLLLRATSSNAPAAAGQADLLLQLADVFGVKLAPDGTTEQTIVPGGQVAYNLTLANIGTSTDTVRFSTTAAPAGWIVQVDPAEVSLGPLENRSLQLLVKAPANAVPRAIAATTLQAASLGSGAVSQVAVKTTVGFYEVNVTVPSGVTAIAPTQTASYVFNVKNNGSLPDQISVTPTLTNAAQAAHVTLTATPSLVVLAANQSQDVRIDVKLGTAPPSDSDIAFTTKFASRLAPAVAPSNQTLALKAHVLRYVTLDPDHDQVKEYAVDGDGQTSNGYEGYLDPSGSSGKASQLADLARYLTDAARTAATKSVVADNGSTIEVFDLVIDPDGDKMRDLLIDSTGDGLPDHYWDPDANKSTDLTIVKDIDADAVADYFVDTDGAAGVDQVYNLRQGTFTKLVETDIDGDGTKDYIVDKNGNGKLDADETVLYSRNGRLVTVQKVDMDDSGELDDVFDTDGDGIPDYFVPFGEEAAVEIVLKDVNGDGKADWAYDADGDGRLDSYYDPATGESGLIDVKGNFQDALRDYWYVGALFGLVLVLFVVLLFVTRR